MKTEYENAIALGHCGILLGSCWLKEMTEESLSALGESRSAELNEALRKLEWKIPQPASSDARDEVIEELAIDYCRLLVGPKGHLSPVESVWVTDQFQSETVSAMQAFFDLLPGYQPPSSLQDHIGVQLDYAGHLLVAAGNLQDPAAFEPVAAFCGSRLGWIDGLLRGGKSRARTDFYRGLSTATERWVADVQNGPF
jgi:TorA maturation chaperone TorD